MVETLGSLVDKNLVRVLADAGGRPRFSMLQTIRQYAQHEQLEADSEVAMSIRRAHAAHYTQVALDLRRGLTYADRAVVLDGARAGAGQPAARGTTGSTKATSPASTTCSNPCGATSRRVATIGRSSSSEPTSCECWEEPETPERKHDELTLQTNLARTQLAVLGFTPEAERSMKAAIERSTDVGDDRHRFAALRSLASLRLMRYELERRRRRRLRLWRSPGRRPISPPLGGPPPRRDQHDWFDDLSVATDHPDQAIACFESTNSGFVEFRVGPNPGVVAYAVAALLSWPAGLADTAVSRMERAVVLAREPRPPVLARIRASSLQPGAPLAVRFRLGRGPPG